MGYACPVTGAPLNHRVHPVSLFEEHARATTPRRPEGLTAQPVSLCVLASSSSGNCSVLVRGEGDLRRAVLIDCGLSPRKTRRLLFDLGLSLEHIDDVLVTHFDWDHFHKGWLRALPAHARLHLHRRHRRDAEAIGPLPKSARLFEDAFELPCGLWVLPSLHSHDDTGVVAYRIEGEGRSLGYATDIGRVTDELIGAMRGVDVLAIESNYCPKMQIESDRPWVLKKRIMGGSGHLSNEQCREAVGAIRPRDHTVLLHLSRQCNTPERAASFHDGAEYALTVSSHERATAEIRIGSV